MPAKSKCGGTRTLACAAAAQGRGLTKSTAQSPLTTLSPALQQTLLFSTLKQMKLAASLRNLGLRSTETLAQPTNKARRWWKRSATRSWTKLQVLQCRTAWTRSAGASTTTCASLQLAASWPLTWLATCTHSCKASARPRATLLMSAASRSATARRACEMTQTRRLQLHAASSALSNTLLSTGRRSTGASAKTTLRARRG